MQVFKQCFKIIKKNIPVLLIYVGIFLAVTILVNTVNSSSNQTSFEAAKCLVAIINEDSSTLATNLENYINENSDVQKIETDEESIKDALFFRKVEVVITIPKNFGESFIEGTPLSLQTQSIPNSSSSVFVKSMINNYLNTTRLYIENANILDLEEINKLVSKDLSIETKINLLEKDDLSGNADTDSYSSINYFFNYLTYPLLMILIFGISIISNIFNSPDLKRRNLCSPISTTSFNLQLFLGDAVLALSTFTIFMVISMIMNKGTMFTINGLYYGINSLIFTFVCLCLSFLLGCISTKSSMSMIATVVSLGYSFLGGAFVPQELLSETVKKLAIVNPAYWYVNINNKINSLSIFNTETLTPILFEFSIMLAFAAVFLGIGLVVMKQRRTKY